MECRPETIWLEPVNVRGKGLTKISAALHLAGYHDQSASVDHIRKGPNWSSCTTALVTQAIDVAARKKVLRKLKILLYPERLLLEHREELKRFDQGIVWLLKTRDGQDEQETDS